MNKYIYLLLTDMFLVTSLVHPILAQKEYKLDVNPIVALGYSTEKIWLADILIAFNDKYYGGLSFAYRDREPGECDEETECYLNCNDINPTDIIRYTHNRYSTMAFMLKGGYKISDYIFLGAIGLNHNKYYDFYDTNVQLTHGCYSKGKSVTRFAYAIGIFHDYVVSPVILGISYSNVYKFGILIGYKF